MRQLVLNRLLFLVPTIFIILCVAFMLQQAAPGDEVLSNLRLDGINVNLSQSEYKEAYQRQATLMNRDLPPFYWSVRPHYFPDSLYRIIPKSYRQNLKSLTLQTGDWQRVSRYHETLQKAINTGAQHKDSLGAIYVQLLKLEQSSDIQVIRNIGNRLSNRSVPSSTGTSDTLGQLKAAIDELRVRRRWSTYPVVSWNGARCQFHGWLKGLASGQRSLVDGAPVRMKILAALKWTLTLSLITLIVAGALGLAVAYYQTKNHNSWSDRVSSVIFYLFYAVPLFWLATMAVVFFTTDEYGSWTNLFPSVGLMYYTGEQPFLVQLIENIKQLILPVICLVLHSMAYLTRQVKTSLLQASNAFYTLVARSKGLNKGQVLRRHALPNALLPYITIMTAALPATFTGSLVIEVIFNIPGMGKLMFDSIRNLDWPVTFSILVLVGVVTVLAYLLADLLYVVFYPHMTKELIRK